MDSNEKEVIFLGQADTSCSKGIYKYIKADILNLNIKDGDFLTLAELAQKYNVSKTPIRDALSALEIEGYLLSLPRKGYLVKPVTPKNMKDLFQMRLILETAAVDLAIKNAADSELSNILKLANEFPNSESYDPAYFNELNFNFHMSIIKASQNSLLIETFTSVFENLSRALKLDSQNIEFMNERDNHINIANALLSKDNNKAKELILNHISNFKTRIYNNHRII